MPKTLMDYMTLIAGWFTILAAIATICGVIYAYNSFNEWKRTYKYSKIIDIDTKINNIKRVLDQGLNFYWLYRTSVINGCENLTLLEEYKVLSEKVDELVSEYEVRGNELIRIGQKDFNQNMVSPVDMSLLVFGVHINTMERKSTIEDLNSYYFNHAVDRNQEVFDRMNKYLTEIRD